MQKVGKFSLKNQAGFNVKLELVYTDDDGNQNHVKGTGSYPLGQTKDVDPGDCGVPDGAGVSLYAFVVLGRDVTAGQTFLYEKGNPKTASYTISGTTLSPSLGLNSIQ